MEIKSKLTGLVKKVKTYPIKTACALGLAGLVTVTALKDNVHFGSVTLNNPQKNNYVWGLFPRTTIKGEKAKGNIYSIGLLFGGNDLGDNSTINGNMSAYGLLFGRNDLRNNSTINGNMRGYGLIVGINDIGDNSSITGNMSGCGLIGGRNDLGDNSTINGDIKTRGILSFGKDFGIGVSTELGLKNYVHHVKEESVKKDNLKK